MEGQWTGLLLDHLLQAKGRSCKRLRTCSGMLQYKNGNFNLPCCVRLSVSALANSGDIRCVQGYDPSTLGMCITWCMLFSVEGFLLHSHGLMHVRWKDIFMFLLKAHITLLRAAWNNSTRSWWKRKEMSIFSSPAAPHHQHEAFLLYVLQKCFVWAEAQGETWGWMHWATSA